MPCATSSGVRAGRARLADYRGRWVALVFYPRDFSLVCPTELTGLGARVDEFRRQDCELLGISSDPVAIHRQWLETSRLR
ncbi:redoxin domain-containing protein, partial [Singulisphaera rosea]